MNVFLLYPDRDFDTAHELPWNEQSICEDLELDILFSAMAGEDTLIYSIVKTALLTGMENDRDTLIYRQQIIKDCIDHPLQVKELYSLARQAIDFERKSFFGVFRYPSAIINRSLEVMDKFVDILKRIRKLADTYQHEFKSPGWIRFFSMIQSELSDSYFNEVDKHLNGLRFKKGTLISANLGVGNKGENYTLRKPFESKQTLLNSLRNLRRDKNLIVVDERDDRGYRALSDIRDIGLNHVANSLAKSVDHILSFFTLLNKELGFYIGCLNLINQIRDRNYIFSFPEPVDGSENMLSFTGLYDICLLLTSTEPVVGNDLNADSKNLLIITGANQGGKSTFLRSLGVSLLMMQAGMFVPAASYKGSLHSSLFTHYRREEDESMKSGKLDEELHRMSEIVERLSPGAIGLFNESFSATNEREGSEIARQIVLSLIESGVSIVFVTHLTDFATSIYRKKLPSTLFLRADRLKDGARTFKILPGEPQDTSFGVDLYNMVFKE